jgi:tripartite-type tricarboxylate transporter receptor subunit TctC
VQRLSGELAKIAQSAEGREWFAAMGTEAGILAGEAFGTFIRSEHARNGKLVRDAGIRLE